MKYNALVLSGGGFNGYYQYSIMEELVKMNINFDYVCGCSTGALNAAMLATDKLKIVGDIYNTIKQSGIDIISTQDYADYVNGEIVLKRTKLFNKATRGLFPFNIFNLPRAIEIISKNLCEITSLSDNTPLLELLKNNITIEDFKIPCDFITVDLNEGISVAFRSDNFDDNTELCKAIVASTSMPGIWSPVKEVKTKTNTYHNLVDGGIRDINPLHCAVNHINSHNSDNNDWTVWIINCTTGYVEPTLNQNVNILSIVKRCLLDISLNEIGSNDLSGFLTMNEILSTFDKNKVVLNRKVFSKFNTISFTPDRPLGEALDYSKEQLNLRYWLGKRAVEKKIDEGVMDSFKK